MILYILQAFRYTKITKQGLSYLCVCVSYMYIYIYVCARVLKHMIQEALRWISGGVPYIYIDTCNGLLWARVFVVVVVVVVGTNKDWGPQNKVPELILEFAWCPLRASLEFCTVLKRILVQTFGSFFSLGKSLLGSFLDLFGAEILQKGVQQVRFVSL